MTFADDGRALYRELAKRAYEDGDHARCLEFAQRLGEAIPVDLQGPMCDSAYRIGLELAAADRFREAREKISLANRLASEESLRRICQDRLVLLKQALRSSRLDPDSCPFCTGRQAIQEAQYLNPDMLQPEVDEVHCIGAYRSGFDRQSSDPLSQMIRKMKEPEGKVFVHKLGQLLGHFVAVHLESALRAKVDLIAPVPTTPARFAKRGYGIPEELGLGISQATSIPSYPKLIVLKRETEELRGLSKTKRQQELEGAYSASDPEMVRGYSIMIVDDVMTYGTTLKEIGRTLRRAGAYEVIGVVLAHTESSGV